MTAHIGIFRKRNTVLYSGNIDGIDFVNNIEIYMS